MAALWPAESRAPSWTSGWRRLGVGLGVSAAMVMAFAAQLPVLDREPVFGTVSALVTVGLSVTALLLLSQPGHRVTALALMASAALYAVGWLNAWERGPMALCAEVLGPLALPFGAWAVLRYPDSRLRRRSERAFVAAAFVWLSAPQALLAPVSRPQWHGFAATAWWPTLWPAPSLYAAGHQVYEAGAAALAASLVVLLLARIAGWGGVDRRVTMPVALTSAAAAAAVGAGAAGEMLALPRPVMYQVYTGSGLILLLIPLGFLAAVVRRRLARAAVADLVLRVARPATAASVREALREALLDPALEVLLWVPEERAHVDGSGARVDPPAASPDRLTLRVDASDGQPLAIVVADPSLLRHRELLDAATTACRMALENARLQAVLRARVDRAPAFLEERRQVERDLHDGAQQRLLALATKLAVARATARDTSTAVAIDDARRDLRLAMQELRDLAQGIHPPVLTQSGLGPALLDVAERLPLAVEVDVPPRRLEARLETTIYLVVCEALANAVKHARSSRAVVRIRPAAGVVRVEVADDGVGGADAASGRGLTSLADRIGALGGELAVVSPREGGTRIVVSLPCG